jgi:hypothetical protein
VERGTLKLRQTEALAIVQRRLALRERPKIENSSSPCGVAVFICSLTVPPMMTAMVPPPLSLPSASGDTASVRLAQAAGKARPSQPDGGGK